MPKRSAAAPVVPPADGVADERMVAIDSFYNLPGHSRDNDLHLMDELAAELLSESRRKRRL